MAESDARNLRGIDGWLLVFLASCVVTSLFYLIAFGFNNLLQQWREQYYGVTLPPMIAVEGGIVECVRIALPLIILWRMIVARRWRTIAWTIAAIWLLFIGLPLADFGFAVAWFGWARVGGGLARLVQGNGVGIVCAVGATFYLLGSRRVAATYPRHVDLDQVFD